MICVGVDGAAIMQGNRKGLCVKLQTSIAPYMIAIHCMAHIMNLANKILSCNDHIANVEDLMREVYIYISNSPKWFREFQDFVDGITNGKKLLKDVEIRWISLYKPACKLLNEYPSLTGFVFKQRW